MMHAMQGKADREGGGEREDEGEGGEREKRKNEYGGKRREQKGIERARIPAAAPTISRTFLTKDTLIL